MNEDKLTHRQRVRLEALARAQAMPIRDNDDEVPSGAALRQRIYAVALEIEKFLLDADPPQFSGLDALKALQSLERYEREHNGENKPIPEAR